MLSSLNNIWLFVNNSYANNGITAEGTRSYRLALLDAISMILDLMKSQNNKFLSSSSIFPSIVKLYEYSDRFSSKWAELDS